MKVSGLSANALYAKCKAMNASRLTRSQFVEMASLSGLSELCTYLKSKTAYADVFSDSTFNTANISRARFEALIKKAVPTREEKILRYAALSGSKIDEYFSTRRDIRIILSGVRHIDNPLYVDPEIMYLPQSARKRLGVDAEEIGNAKSLGELLELLDKTPYKKYVIGASAGPHAYCEIQNMLNGYLFDTAFRVVNQNLSGKEKDEAKELFSQMSDIITVFGLYRIKSKYYDSAEAMSQVFVSSATGFDANELERLKSAHGVKELASAISKTHRARLFSDFVGEGNEKERLLYRICSKKLATSQNPVVCAVCYDELLRMECMDISTVAEGIGYKLPPEETMSFLIREGK